MKKLIATLFIFIFTIPVYASYIDDLDFPVPDKLIEFKSWNQVNCDGGTYLFLPTLYEWVSWGYDSADYKYLEPEDAIYTEHFEVNTWQMSYADRYCKAMFNLQDYNLVSFLTMYNELIPFQKVADGDENLKFNYPFDIREYSWKKMNFNEIDWETQKHWLKIRKYVSDEEEFLFKTNIPEAVSMFGNKYPNTWQIPAIPSDWGLIGRIIEPTRSKNKAKTYPENDINFYRTSETRKDISYFDRNNYSINWEQSPYIIWRYSQYASRWFFPDIVNAVAGELNYRWVHDKSFEYKNIPDYFFEAPNLILPIPKTKNVLKGIKLAYEYCRIMECTKFDTEPNEEQIEAILKYTSKIKKSIKDSKVFPYKFIDYMSEDTKSIKKYIEEKEKIKISDSNWYYTIAYLVNSNGVEGYLI